MEDLLPSSDLKNWRPISLLNVDYKICSKAITLRLAKVLDSIIDPDQTCSVPGRTISNNLVLLRDTLEYITQTDETGILVSLDQEKAFDRVNRMFLMELLDHFGFGSDFCRWISTFYLRTKCYIFYATDSQVNSYDMSDIARGSSINEVL